MIEFPIYFCSFVQVYQLDTIRLCVEKHNLGLLPSVRKSHELRCVTTLQSVESYAFKAYMLTDKSESRQKTLASRDKELNFKINRNWERTLMN